MKSEKPDWLKGRGYLHITPKLNLQKRGNEYLSKLKNPAFIAKHSFFPLIHYKIKERKYKKHPYNPLVRVHSYIDKEKYIQTAKYRPIHYATHFDALIFAYYAELLADKYKSVLIEHPGLGDCIIAYRKIPIDDTPDSKGKSTIHFAKEAFDEIEKRSIASCSVLMFDIKSFFSELDHVQLKRSWAALLGESKRLPNDHFNVFNAATNFSYILRDELRKYQSRFDKRPGFDEKKLSWIRKQQGDEAYFKSLAEFRNAIRTNSINVYKRQFMKNGAPVGIPQGLPISSVLANLYLFNFDTAIFEKIVTQFKGFYRRYSDDILIVCKPEQVSDVKQIVDEEINRSNLQLSKDKTENFIFKQSVSGKIGSRLHCFQILEDGSEKLKPLTYLGFHFYGYQTRIKSGNIAKFHRKTIDAVKRKSKRIERILISQPHIVPAIFINQIKRLSTSIKKETEIKKTKGKYLTINDLGEHVFHIREFKPKHSSNYISYVRRVSNIFGDDQIYNQIHKRRKILHEALFIHYKRKLIKMVD